MSNQNQAIDYYNRGCQLVKQKCDAEALREFEKAIKCDPALAVAFINAGNCLRRGSRYDESAYYYLKAIELDTDNLLAHFNYGCTLFCMYRYQDALNEFETACQINSTDEATIWKLAQCYANKGESFRGIKYAVKAFLMRPFALTNYTQFAEVIGLAILNCLIKSRKK